MESEGFVEKPPPYSATAYQPQQYPTQQYAYPVSGGQASEQQEQMLAQTATLTSNTQRPAGSGVMIFAILAALCCCPLTGAFAIYYAYESDQMFNRGDLTGAREKAKTSKTLSIVSTIIGCLLILLIIAIEVAVIVSWNSSY